MGEWQELARTILGWIGLWCLASILITGTFGILRARVHIRREAETDWSFPGHPTRYMTLPPTEYERMEALQTAARSVG